MMVVCVHACERVCVRLVGITVNAAATLAMGHHHRCMSKGVAKEEPEQYVMAGGNQWHEAHLQSTLKSTDGQKSQILLLLCIAHQVHIHQLLQLKCIQDVHVSWLAIKRLSFWSSAKP